MIFPPDNRKHVIWHSVLATNVGGAGRLSCSCHTGMERNSVKRFHDRTISRFHMSCAPAHWVGSKPIRRVMQLKLHKPTMAIGYGIQGRSNLVFRSKPIPEAKILNRLILTLLRAPSSESLRSFCCSVSRLWRTRSFAAHCATWRITSQLVSHFSPLATNVNCSFSLI